MQYTIYHSLLLLSSYSLTYQFTTTQSYAETQYKFSIVLHFDRKMKRSSMGLVTTENLSTCWKETFSKRTRVCGGMTLLTWKMRKSCWKKQSFCPCGCRTSSKGFGGLGKQVFVFLVAYGCYLFLFNLYKICQSTSTTFK